MLLDYQEAPVGALTEVLMEAPHLVEYREKEGVLELKDCEGVVVAERRVPVELYQAAVRKAVAIRVAGLLTTTF